LKGTHPWFRLDITDALTYKKVSLDPVLLVAFLRLIPSSASWHASSWEREMRLRLAGSSSLAISILYAVLSPHCVYLACPTRVPLPPRPVGRCLVRSLSWRVFVTTFLTTRQEDGCKLRTCYSMGYISDS
jgi:hypothetical protein